MGGAVSSGAGTPEVLTDAGMPAVLALTECLRILPWANYRKKTMPTSVSRLARTPTSRPLTSANYRGAAHVV